jgi:hypothetical protein
MIAARKDIRQLDSWIVRVVEYQQARMGDTIGMLKECQRILKCRAGLSERPNPG